MNWLAHLHLAEADGADRVGNLLPDMANKRECDAMPPNIRHGVARHRFVDTYLDHHPMFFRSRARLKPPFRRFAGIVVDVFYDHYLTRHWATYCDTPMLDFVAEACASMMPHLSVLPPRPQRVISRMCHEGWITGYGTIDGIALTLSRIDRRLSRPVGLAGAVQYLEAEWYGFEDDFLTFYPELIYAVDEWKARAASAI
ncbi:MAG: ACP phosphodiesterase [Rhodothermales bacterium]